MRTTLVVTAVLLVAVMLVSVQVATAGKGPGQPKLLICHVPPGNLDNPLTLEIGKPAVADAHLRNHADDSEGACGEQCTLGTPPEFFIADTEACEFVCDIGNFTKNQATCAGRAGLNETCSFNPSTTCTCECE